MTETKRDRRRRDLQRMKARARRLYPGKPKAAFWANHLAVCSCAVCGNPRRYWKAGSTAAERRAEASAQVED